MREIKFRAFVFEENRYYNQVCHTDDYLYRLINIESSDGINNTIKVHYDIPFKQTWFTNEKGNISKFVLEQYTEIKDKNGVEIYEGDILNTEQGICSVIWFDSAFALKSPRSEAIDFEHSSFYELSEIIGNIHENPELLNTQNN